MTVLTCQLTKNSGTFVAWEGGTYMLMYRVTTDDAVMPIPTILEEAAALDPTGDVNQPIPAPGAIYNGDPGARARNFRVEQLVTQGGLTTFDITVTFSRNTDGQGDEQVNDDPIQWEPVIWYEYERYQVPLLLAKNKEEHTYADNNYQSITGAITPTRPVDTLGWITNTAGDPFETQPTRELEASVLAFRKNYASLSAIDTVRTDFEETWNDATFWGRPAHFVRFKSIRADKPKVYFNGTVYYPAVIRLDLDRDDLQVGLLEFDNIGKQSLFPAGSTLTGKTVNIDEQLNQLTDPQPLELDGTQVPGTVTAGKITYEYLTEADYTQLGIGPAIPS